MSRTIHQADLAATTLTDIYTAPTEANIMHLSVCNHTGGALTFRLALAPNGEADNAKHYILYGKSVPATDTYQPPYTLPVPAQTVLRAYASAVGISITVIADET